jgi:hypothetical protein
LDEGNGRPLYNNPCSNYAPSPAKNCELERFADATTRLLTVNFTNGPYKGRYYRRLVINPYLLFEPVGPTIQLNKPQPPKDAGAAPAPASALTRKQAAAAEELAQEVVKGDRPTAPSWSS